VSTKYPSELLRGDDRLLVTLQRLLAITSVELRPALTEACNLVTEAVSAEKVDVFLYQASSDSLVALGTSQTPMGRRQHELGLERYPRTNANPLTAVFETGTPYHTGHADQDSSQPRGVVDAEQGLGVRSQADVPIEVAGERRGILSATSAAEEHFSEKDVSFLQAVAGWIGLVIQRGELAEAQQESARQQGRQELAEEIARLTPRQREIAALVAEGLSNEEIAQRLVVTPGTMGNHMEQILRRLGRNNRTQLAVWAVMCGLYRPGMETDA
jgi:two-component system OmpR family sensor kinase